VVTANLSLLDAPYTNSAIQIYTKPSLVPQFRNYVIPESESELLYDWLFIANQFVLASSPLRLTAKFFSQLNTYGHSPYIISSLTRGWVCHLKLLLVLARTFIRGPESRGTRYHILLSQIRDFPFCRLLRPAGLRWRYSSPHIHEGV
jgi:hypothetical protein